VPIPTAEPVIRQFTNRSITPGGPSPISLPKNVTPSEARKLALGLLPVLVSRIKTLGQSGSKPHEFMVVLLELEKIKAAETSIQEVLKIKKKKRKRQKRGGIGQSLAAVMLASRI